MKRQAVIGSIAAAGALVLGCLVYAGDARARGQPQIDPAIVDCSTFVSNSQSLCLDMADEMFQLVQLIFEQFVAGDPRALTETVPTTMTVFPDGSVEYGLEGLAKRSAALFGSNNLSFIEIMPTLRYKPLDERTIVFAGTVAFTLQDHESADEIRTVTFAQTQLFRRNPHLPRGWEQLEEQLSYVSPLIGD